MAEELVTVSRLKFEADRNLERRLREIQKLLDGLAKPRKAPPVGNPRATETARQKLERFARQQELTNRLMERHGVTAQAAGRAVRAYGRDLDRADREAGELAVRLDRAQRQTRELTAAQRAANRTGRTSLVTIRDLRAGYAGLAGAFGIGAVTAAARSSVVALTEMEAVQRSLNKATGGQGAKSLAFVRSEADRLGLALGSTAAEYAKLEAAAIGTSLAGAGVRDIFSSVSAVGSELGISVDDQVGALRALGQIMSKGTVQAEELRGQLGERIPGAFQIMARALGVTTRELGKMLEAGEVLADDALPAFAEELRKTFGVDTTSRIDTTAASIARVKTELFELRAASGKLIIEAGGGEALEETARNLRSIREFLEDVPKMFRRITPEVDTSAEALRKVQIQAQAAAVAQKAMAEGVSPAEVRKRTQAFLDRAKALHDAFKAATRYSKENVSAGMSADQFAAAEKRLSEQLKARDDATEEALQITRALRTEQEILDEELAEAEDLYRKGALAEETLSRARAKHAKETEKLTKIEADRAEKTEEAHDAQVQAFREVERRREDAVRAIEDEIAALETADGIVRDFGVSQDMAAEAARLMAAANLSAADAVALLQERAAARGGEMGPFLTPEAAERIREAERLTEALQTRTEAYREEVAKVRADLADGLISEETARRALESLDAQMEGWELVAMAAEDAAERAGGAWSQALGGIAENLGGIVGALDQVAGMLEAGGKGSAAGYVRAASSFAQGDYAGAVVGLVQASGFGGGGVSQFGGQMGGNLMAEGAEIGGQLGGGWGAVFGAAIGAMISTGADDLHAAVTEEAGRAVLVIEQAEGGLAEIAGKIKGQVEGFLNGLQDVLVADLDFAVEGAGIHIREDRVRVRLMGGMEKVFQSLDEAMDFFIRGMLQYNAQAEGLGENMRDLFEGASLAGATGDLERLEAAFDLARRLDFEATGVDEAALARRRQILELAREFNLSQAATIALLDSETRARRAQIEASARGILGATDYAGQILAVTEAMRTANATSERQRAMDMARAEELRGLLAAQDEVIAGEGEIVRQREGGMGRLLREGEVMGRELGETAAGIAQAVRDTEAWAEELAALEDVLSEAPEAFGADEIGRLWEKAALDAGGALDAMISQVRGAGETEERARERRHALFMLQLFAEIESARLVLSTMENVNASVRAMLEATIADAEKLFQDLAEGRETLDLGRPGGGRRQQALEEERRAAEEAARTLEEFRDELARMELNASAASGSLGELAGRLDEIAARAAGAAEAGASPEDVRRFQELGFRGERQALLAPFRQGPEGFGAASVELEAMRRDAIEQARLIAAAQAEALGTSFETLFAAMVAEIERGTDKMEAALARGVVDAFGLPIMEARRGAQEFRQQILDLRAAYAQGKITGRQYETTVRQIQRAQERALGADVLALVDRYYSEIEGGEELRRRLAELEFQDTLRIARLRLDMLVAEGALAQDAIDRLGGMITFMEENPPDWDALFSGAGPAAAASFGGPRASAASTASGIDDLARAIRDFVAGFERVDVGRLEAQARDWTTALTEFDVRIGDALATGGARTVISNFGASLFGVGDAFALTASQLDEIAASIPASHVFFDEIQNAIDVLQAAGGLSAVEADMPAKILSMYRGTLEATTEMERRYDAINEEFRDAAAALDLVGASAEQLADAEQVRQDRILAFWDDYLDRFRDFGDELRGGAFGGVRPIDVAASARERFEELRARVQADPFDFEAREELEGALREFIDAEKALSGGVGADFGRIVREALAFIDGMEVPDVLPPAAESPPDMMAALDLQTLAAQESAATLGEMRTLLGEQNDILAQLVAAQSVTEPPLTLAGAE